MAPLADSRTIQIKRRYFCRRCRIRWPQRKGLCRTCAKIEGDRTTTQERDAETLRLQRIRVETLLRAEALLPPLRTVVIRGEAFEVVWPRI